jgi:uncharacterized protein YceK
VPELAVVTPPRKEGDRVPRWIIAVVLAATALLAAGCGTYFNLTNEEGMRVYGGVRADMTGPCGGNVLDLPFSAVGDTLTLPVTVPCSLYRIAH